MLSLSGTLDLRQEFEGRRDQSKTVEISVKPRFQQVLPMTRFSGCRNLNPGRRGRCFLIFQRLHMFNSKSNPASPSTGTILSSQQVVATFQPCVYLNIILGRPGEFFGWKRGELISAAPLL